MVPESPSEKCLGGCDIPLGTKQKIDRFALFVDRAIKISPAAFDLHIGLVDAPGPAYRSRETIPALLEFRNIALDPAHNRRMRQGEPAFSNHLDEVSKAEFVPEIPTHTKDDDLPIEVPAFEEFIHAQHASQLHRELRDLEICLASDLCTTTKMETLTQTCADHSAGWVARPMLR